MTVGHAVADCLEYSSRFNWRECIRPRGTWGKESFVPMIMCQAWRRILQGSAVVNERPQLRSASQDLPTNMVESATPWGRWPGRIRSILTPQLGIAPDNCAPMDRGTDCNGIEGKVCLHCSFPGYATADDAIPVIGPHQPFRCLPSIVPPSFIGEWQVPAAACLCPWKISGEQGRLPLLSFLTWQTTGTEWQRLCHRQFARNGRQGKLVLSSQT